MGLENPHARNKPSTKKWDNSSLPRVLVGSLVSMAYPVQIPVLGVLEN